MDKLKRGMTTKLAAAMNTLPKAIAEARRLFTPIPRPDSESSTFSSTENLHEEDFLAPPRHSCPPNLEFRQHDLRSAATPQEIGGSMVFSNDSSQQLASANQHIRKLRAEMQTLKEKMSIPSENQRLAQYLGIH